MKILRKNIGDNQLDVSLFAEPEEFAKALSDAYIEQTDRYPVPGVAAGLADRKMLEQYYGEHVLYDAAVDLLVPKLYRAFLEREKLHTIGTPSLEEVTWKDGGGFSFDVKAALMPEVELGIYKGIKSPYTRSDAETFEGYVLSEACRGMKTRLSDVIVEKKLDAMEAAEKVKTARDPIYHVLADAMYALKEGYYLAEVYRSQQQINAEAMDIMLQTVSGDNEKVTPERFIALVADLAGRYHTLPERFEEKMAAIMEKRSEKKKSMSGEELLDEAFKAYLGSVEMNEKQWRDLNKEKAAKEALLDLLFGAVAEKEKLTISKQEYLSKVKEIAEETGMELDEVLPQIDEDSVRRQLLREKAKKFILDSALEKAEDKAEDKAEEKAEKKAEKKAPEQK